MKRVVISFFLGVILFSCGVQKENEEYQKPSQKLFDELMAIGNDAVLFGHQDDLAYGMNWAFEDGRSDTKEAVGDYPAVFGWELGALELGHEVNLDSVPFDWIRKYAIKGYEMGGVLTFSWHPFSAVDTSNSSWVTEPEIVKHIIPGGSHHDEFKVHLDRVAKFFSSLRTEDGNSIPFIFRPWHEMDGDWFWWGSASCTPAEFKELFRFTVEYLREEKQLDFLSAYSPDNRFNSEDEYLTWYPGDDVVELIGVDNYGDFRIGSVDIEAAEKKIEIVVKYAQKTGKIAALTETGLLNMTDEKWFSQKLQKAFLESEIASEIAYVLLWHNYDSTRFFSSYPGHNSVPDFRDFVSNDSIWLLEDWNQFKASKNF